MKFFALMVVLVFTGCTATGPLFKPVTTPAEQAEFYIYWEKLGGIVLDFPIVSIDGVKVGALRTGGYLRSEIKEGNHSLKVGDNPMNWGFKDLTFNFNAEKTSSYYFKILYTTQAGILESQYTVDIVPVDRAIALAELKDTRLSN